MAVKNNSIDLEDQDTFKEKLGPILEKKGALYEKVKRVFAKRAKGGEYIKTITQDGLETTNTAKKGDFIIKNQTQAKEQYIVSKDKFQQRYKLFQKKADEFNEYQPTGKIIAIEVDKSLLKRLGYQDEFYFIAPWGERMIAKEKDFLACSLELNDIYRIARKEFFETYRKIK